MLIYVLQEQSGIAICKRVTIDGPFVTIFSHYSKGQCTWGASCRFVHPGVLDKGNYNMFAPPRPILPTEQEPIEKVNNLRKYYLLALSYTSLKRIG